MILRRESLEDILDRIEDLYESGEPEKARKVLRKALRRHPEDLTLLEWKATFADDDGNCGEALSILEKVLLADPDRPFARREKVTALMGLGRFGEALDLLQEIGPQDRRDGEYHHDLAICLDRMDRSKEADREFRLAERLDPDGLPAPSRLSQDTFQKIVRREIEAMPERLRRYLDNVIVEVADYPRSPPLDPGLDPFLLGLYVGVPRTERTQDFRDHLDRIFIFKRNLEIEFPDGDELKEEIRKTVIHEIAHHFGLGEDEMGEYA